jgi:hypothetical protein
VLKEHALPLEERHIVDANRPLRDTLLLLRDHGVLLVRSPESGYPDGISGIINHADIQKTPVRLLLFAQITEIETRLRNRVSRTCWEKCPNCETYKNTAKRRMKKWKDPEGRLPLANYLNPRELMLLIKALEIPLLQKLWGAGSKILPEDEFEKLAKELKDLRNAIAHSNDIGYRCGTNPLNTIQSVNSAFDLVDNILADVRRLG